MTKQPPQSRENMSIAITIVSHTPLPLSTPAAENDQRQKAKESTPWTARRSPRIVAAARSMVLFTTSQTNPFKNSSGSAHRLTSRTTGSKPFNRPKHGDSHKPDAKVSGCMVYTKQYQRATISTQFSAHTHTLVQTLEEPSRHIGKRAGYGSFSRTYTS